ncbi:protein-glutamine gamma-glutamyltransferase 5-like isoform X2 [Cynoglossus semilaevis]|uniref:Protein-glutamine gamma-glutamyltransferase 5-like n=1 Tax=Cynoglossus semilaevis TaxID=244447 RepID=A0A3P8USS3_CYNSE|nr:protein-glutamine gamma-glutamyltransferase 5-like isoform X2 [Cynoglossus semilaevis]
MPTKQHSFTHLQHLSQTMDMQRANRGYVDINRRHCKLKLVDFHIHENLAYHRTEGLSKKHLVARRGKPFKVTLVFCDGPWNPRTENLVLEVLLGNLSKRIHVQISDSSFDLHHWSATLYPGNRTPSTVTIHICSPVLSAVAQYNLLVHFENRYGRRSYVIGSFVLLCNPWLKDDPVFMPTKDQLEEYIISDYGMVYMGTELNVCQRPWTYGQYEPGVLEACLQLLEVSLQHCANQDKDNVLRGDPVYLSRVLCAMVNCDDDLGILQGKWSGTFDGGVKPTEWSGSADILHQWVSSNCRPVRYGQCWVFASVLCTVMRVLGIPSRVVTVFNAGHDGNANTQIEEVYSTTGEKLNLSKDSIWNFHVWVESWMKRPDLGEMFDGWQVVDPTPQEKSAGIYVCGPCPVAAIQQRCLKAPYDAPFIYASVDADVIRLIVRNGLVVGRKVDSECVGALIYTKGIGTDKPENLTNSYKMKKYGQMRSMRCEYNGRGEPSARLMRSSWSNGGDALMCYASRAMVHNEGSGRGEAGDEAASNLEVSIKIEGKPTVGDSIRLCVMVKNTTTRPRALMEHVNAQVKEYNSNPKESFWKTYKELYLQPLESLAVRHTIPLSEYESAVAADGIVNLAVVMKDTVTEERVLEIQEFNLSSPKIDVEIEGGDSIVVNRQYSAKLTFTNRFNTTLTGAVLKVEGFGLLKGSCEARMSSLNQYEKIEKKVSLMATSPGTKVLMATFSHSNNPTAVSRSFHKVTVNAS